MNDTSSTSILAGLIMAPRRLLLLLIRCYQTLLSPLLGPHCRFHPSCSCYAYNAIAQYGCWKGSWLALRRIVRCTPFSDGGLDPVPQPPSSKRIKNPNGYQA